jgi:hypothetical protein
MTPQMTTERAVARFRVNPKVDVAVAVSSLDGRRIRITFCRMEIGVQTVFHA